MASNEELPPRYRFMLQDTIDLRSNQVCTCVVY